MKTIDTVWMIVRSDAVIYAPPATSARDAWKSVVEGEVMGTGVTRAELLLCGWRARRVDIVLRE